MMEAQPDLEAVEKEAYRAAYSDGIIDLFAGLSLVVIGAIWLLATDYAGLAGIFPAVLVPSLVPMRKRIVESRGGYVRWSAPRRRWEQRNMWVVFTAGCVTFLLGIGAYLAFEGSGSGRDLLIDLAPGMLAFILAVLCLVLGLVMSARRFVAYAAVLVAAGVLAAVRDTNPGVPLLIAGSFVAVIGAAMLVRYLRANPAVEIP